MSKVYIETYGCQMNEYDTELVKTILNENHYDFAEEPEDAQVIFLNTCSVRENAHEKVHQRLGLFRQLRREKKDLVLGVLGCMAQNLRKELLEKEIGVDIVAGPDSYKKLPEMLNRVHKTGQKELSLTLSEFETYSDVFPTRESGVNAWVAVMRGCDNFCTFCVVPYTRGRERSRDPRNVVEEVQKLVEDGFKQVTLLGQNVNSYKYKSYDFADLVEMVSEVSGIKRIRFTSPHPKDFPHKIIDVVANNEKVCRQIHLPLQSGNDRILEMMNRTYTQKEFLDLVTFMRERMPDLALSTDVIVGFPTERDDEYQDTLKVMREVRFDSAFMFKYSERKQTIAERKFPDDVPEEVKTERLIELVEMQRKINFEQNQPHLGKTFEVLVEGKAKKPDQLMGRNEANKIVVFADGGQQVGDFVDVQIDEVTPNTLIGGIV
jgi:tRNA-2-methylthio-N6-dimethylallyladenosine synthase